MTLRTDRLVNRILTILAIYGILAYIFTVTIILVGSKSFDEKTIILEAGGLILCWIIVGGLFMRAWRDPLVIAFRSWSIPWGLRFVLLTTFLAMMEEVVTTGLSFLARSLGASEKGIITASTNYFEVIGLNSVVVLVPLFAVWALMLRWWDFKPVEVKLLFGLTGTLAETTSFGSQNLLMVGFWVFVYGLMIWLPAWTIPSDRGARPVRWWHWLIAVFLPFVGNVPVAMVVILVRKAFYGG
jgi:hypothetical protein